jgi:RAB protein geranylgeranyltransferase component A
LQGQQFFESSQGFARLNALTGFGYTIEQRLLGLNDLDSQTSVSQYGVFLGYGGFVF